MSAAQVLGALLLSSPFVAVFAWMWHEGGLLVAIGLYVVVALIVGVIMAGVYLTTGSPR